MEGGRESFTEIDREGGRKEAKQLSQCEGGNAESLASKSEQEERVEIRHLPRSLVAGASDCTACFAGTYSNTTGVEHKGGSVHIIRRMDCI
jgi:hypothetical protein